MFKVQILGRLGKDATIYESSSTGVKFITFTLAVNTKNLNEDKTYWIDVRSFNPNHLKLKNYLTKGKVLMVGGDFNTGTITDKSGTVRITHSVTCDYISFANIGTKTDANSSKQTVKHEEEQHSNRSEVDEDNISMGIVPVTENLTENIETNGSTENTYSGDIDNELPF